jgi:hypothetical protein
VTCKTLNIIFDDRCDIRGTKSVEASLFLRARAGGYVHSTKRMDRAKVDPIVQLRSLMCTTDVFEPQFKARGVPILESIVNDASLFKRAMKEFDGFSKFYCEDTALLLYHLGRHIQG